MRVLGIDFVVCSIGDGQTREAVSFYRDTLGFLLHRRKDGTVG